MPFWLFMQFLRKPLGLWSGADNAERGLFARYGETVSCSCHLAVSVQPERRRQLDSHLFRAVRVDAPEAVMLTLERCRKGAQDSGL